MKWSFLDLFRSCGRKYGEDRSLDGSVDWVEIVMADKTSESSFEIVTEPIDTLPLENNPPKIEVKPAPVGLNVRNLVALYEKDHPTAFVRREELSPSDLQPVTPLDVEIELRKFQAGKRRQRLDQRAQIEWNRRRQSRSRQATFPPPNYHLTSPYRSLQ